MPDRTTDPRITALAEAIKAATISPQPRSYEDTATAIAREIIRLLPPDWCGHADEIADLRERVADEGYRDAIRLAEAVNKVVLHQRGSIEEAWKYGDEQRAITIKQGRELIAAEAEIARLRRIEEAARALVRWVDDESITLCTICDTDRGHFPECPMPALRAALEEKP